jgi:hypothetical protein
LGHGAGTKYERSAKRECNSGFFHSISFNWLLKAITDHFSKKYNDPTSPLHHANVTKS